LFPATAFYGVFVASHSCTIQLLSTAFPNVQVSDTTGDDSSNAAQTKN